MKKLTFLSFQELSKNEYILGKKICLLYPPNNSSAPSPVNATLKDDSFVALHKRYVAI